MPWVFTEHGAIQAANVLNSPRAVEMGNYVVRVFVKLRELLASNRELARRFEQFEARVEILVAHEQALGVILSAIRPLLRMRFQPRIAALGNNRLILGSHVQQSGFHIFVRRAIFGAICTQPLLEVFADHWL